MRHRPFLLAALFAAFATVACSAGSDTGSNTGSGGGGVGGNGTGGSSFMSGAGGSTGSSSHNCSEATQYVYVLSTQNDLYRFAPDQKMFTLVGHLGCNTPMQPNSMAVDRNAVAWVNYVQSGANGDKAGVIYKVSTADASCEPTPTVTLPSQAWYRLGMGFSSDTVDGASETLFVAGTGTPGLSNSPGLARIDPATNTVVPIGSFTGGLTGQSAELTGTGDARLYGFFTSSPVHVAEIDEATGATPPATDAALPQVPTPSAWAFSFWGGDFYLYTSNGTANSSVVHYSPSTGAVDTAYMPNVGFIIVGAGVSTCAPLTPPA